MVDVFDKIAQPNLVSYMGLSSPSIRVSSLTIPSVLVLMYGRLVGVVES
jgi:hypothetical protein